jgi:hypothetical protein
MRLKDFRQNVFINCPFDSDYAPLFYSIVFAVQIAGFRPRCALEASNAAIFRLQKIRNIISECKYGIHDISRTELTSKGLPRFNMPLEFGIDYGSKEFGSSHHRSKSFLVMDRALHRYEQFISDIKGQDIESHNRSPKRAINVVRDWLAAEAQQPGMVGGDYMYKRYQAFQRDLPALCKAAKKKVKKLTFGDYVEIVRVWLEENER